MSKTLQAAALAAAFILSLAPAALAQSGIVRGRVVDVEDKPIVGAAISIEFTDGVTRKFDVKTDRRGEFIQIGLPPGNYRITATAEKIGTQSQMARVRVGVTFEANFKLVPGAGGGDPAEAAKALELKKLFEDGVAASRANDHDMAIEKFNTAAAAIPNCYDCYYNIGYAYSQKKDEKQAEAMWLKALEMKPDYAEALNALATMYNNQKRFEEAAAMGARAASAGGSGGSADAIYNQGIILWNQGKIPEAKAKFEEALTANPNHAESNFQFGMALLNEGNLAGAIESFEKYLQLAPDGQYAAQAKGMLAQLKK
jgi:tetratricopeptide (TPR) repeat protein